MTFRHSILPLLLLASVLALAAAPHDYKTPDKDWGKGPVRWILTEDEEKEWKKLRADPERAAFAKTFWEKRDPTPGTPENEYEIIFWKKVEEADKRFSTQADKGCLTDMGRVFLLLGPPPKFDKDARGRNIWSYEPNPVTGIKEKLDLMFAQGMLALAHHPLNDLVGPRRNRTQPDAGLGFRPHPGHRLDYLVLLSGIGYHLAGGRLARSAASQRSGDAHTNHPCCCAKPSSCWQNRSRHQASAAAPTSSAGGGDYRPAHILRQATRRPLAEHRR